MFEGPVRQLLLGYLGKYIKDFHQQQLKITLDEIVLKDVQLILEAFDYLQLPVALKQCHVGRLRIGISWKKLSWESWDPIVISLELEDVHFCAGPRDDHEWSVDAVERRELAAKKAKLAAAELAKLSRRVCDNQAGQSLISHVTGRILDSIQVSMRNVHIVYCDTESPSMLFGLRFSSLEMKQAPDGPLSSKARGGQVNKTVEIYGLGIYCCTLEGFLNSLNANVIKENVLWQYATTNVDKYDYLVTPFDLSLQVTKSGKLELDAPQYSVAAELTKLVMTINPTQLQHILKFSDYICTCQLREKYGRYRPWDCPLSKKVKGWQKVWWRYAKESVIFDVRKRRKKTSWWYLGQKLVHLRKYVNLYKVKLDFLQREQPVDQDTQFKLEQMEKDVDLEDILRFRSIAEQELEDSQSSVSSDAIEGSSPAEDGPDDEVSTVKSRGWLNWLSRGVLGAGGTDDSSQFSGVVSDEVLKDICKATKFQPMPNVNLASSGVAFLFAVNFHISEMSISMNSSKLGQEIAELSSCANQIEFNVWEESTTILAKVGSAKVTSSSKQMALLQMKKVFNGENGLLSGTSPSSIEVDIALKNQMAESMFRVKVQPVEIYCDLESLLPFGEFFSVMGSHKSLQQRVLLSLNGIKDASCRLQSKAECVRSGRQRVVWDVNFVNVSISFPWKNANSESCSLTVQTNGLWVSSNLNISSVSLKKKDQYQISLMKSLLGREDGDEILNALPLDIYDHYEVSMGDFQVTLNDPVLPQGLSVVEKFSVSVSLAHCIIPDEMMLKQLEARFILSSLHVHFSAVIHNAFLSLAEHIHLLSSNSKQVLETSSQLPNTSSCYPTMPFHFSIAANLELFNLEVDLGDCQNNIFMMLSLRNVNLKFAHSQVEDCWVSIRVIKIFSYRQMDNRKIICSSRMTGDEDILHQQTVRSENGGDRDWNELMNGCFLLHYVADTSGQLTNHRCTLYLSDIDFHCYPDIVQLLVGFFEKLMLNGSGVDKNSLYQESNSTNALTSNLQRFGVSNFCENGQAEWANIPLDRFPFISIRNSGRLRDLDSAIIIPEWMNIKMGEKNVGNLDCKKNLKTPFVKAPEPGDNCMNLSLLNVQVDMENVRIHFHDLSCVIGSITIPVGKASISSNSDQFDVLSSVEGLTLFSEWWTCNFQEFLWGPTHPNIFPVLNIRIRRGSAYHMNSDLEISFGIQHVCCVLPPEYLAILIGYFTLPDWSSNDGEHQATEKYDHIDTDYHGSIVYKFEIIESVLISPVESNKKQFLKLDIPQLYCSFIEDDALEKASISVFSEFSIQEDEVADRAHSLNMFGRDLHLSFLTLKDFGSEISVSDKNSENESCTLVHSLGVDLWLRLSENSVSQSSMYILTKIACCELNAEDSNFICGFGAFTEVIDQYALVDKKSQYFKSDIPGFFELINSLKDINSGNPEDSSMAVTEIRCCVTSMAVNLISLKRDSNSRDVIGRLELDFILSATLQSDLLLCLDIQISTLLLSASHKSIRLAQCLSDSACASVRDICLSANQQYVIDLHIAIPSLDIWLHLSDWVTVIDHVYSCFLQYPQGSVGDTTGRGELSEQTSLQSQTLSLPGSNRLGDNAVSVVVKSKNINVSCHIPLWVSENAIAQSDYLESHGLNSETHNSLSGGKDTKFLTVTLQSRSFELQVNGRNLNLKSDFEKLTGSVGICESGSVQSWPFFQLFQLGIDMHICEYEEVQIGVKVQVHCEAFDVWLSQQVFYFWQCIEFGTAEANSEITFRTFDLKLQLKKASLLLTDGRLSGNGPLIELLMKDLFFLVENTTNFSAEGDLLVNYNNIHKVMWEPLLEPWSFQVTMTRNYDKDAPLGCGNITDVLLESTTQLNINITKSLCEVVLRAMEMIKESRDLVQTYEVPKSQRLQNLQCIDNLCTRRYASYTIHNMTSLPFVFHVHQGLGHSENVDVSTSAYKNTVQPGASIPIYINGTLEEPAFSDRPASSSEGHSKKLSSKAGHSFMTIQFEGTSESSEPISMDLVGLTYFDVNFSNDNKRADANIGLLVPVVFDVSLQRYSKLIRLYSTVIFKNSTSMPLQLRFDIPFGMSSKIVDSIKPGDEFPLPLHLAEAGHMMWRPNGNNYMWCEVHNLSMILSPENRSGFLRYLACNPFHPSNYLFRCCLSVQDISLSLSGRLRRSPCLSSSLKQSVTACDQPQQHKRSKTRFIHRVTLTTPLTVKNYLPHPMSVTIEGGGATLTTVVKEVEASFFHVDSSHDLGVTFNIAGFGPAAVKFPRAETFSATAKPSGTVLSLTETMALSADLSDGSIYVVVEKMMDSLSGARELCISVPFLLYNCTGFALTVSRSDHELQGNHCIVPTCYDSTEQGLFIDQKDGLHLLPSEDKPHPRALNYDSESYLSKKHVIPSKKFVNPHSGIILTQSSVSHGTLYHQSVNQMDLVEQEDSQNNLTRNSDIDNQSEFKVSNVSNNECLKAIPVMYSPDPSSVASEIMVKVTRYPAEYPIENLPSSSWSSPFFLVAPSGSTAVLVPEPSSSSASVISVTSHLLDTPLMGRTRAITFQPRYVISNACSKPLWYKQKDTDFLVRLGIGQHSHLHWIDTTRELLLTACFDETGCQWSGSFHPDHLGDTQVKMRNYFSGASNVIRIEVQNADVIQDEKIIDNAIGKSGTNFILLSDDDTGFMPYRIDNFTKETLRIYQQKCETLETIVHPYTSCPYAWDEPFFPHRLIVEIPGKRTLGRLGPYTLDDVKEYPPIKLVTSSMSLERHEKTLLSSVRAEGAIKVLSIIDSSCHVLEEVKSPSSISSGKKENKGVEMNIDYKEKVSVKISFIGISLMDSSPQELLYASAKDIRFDFLQSVERQSFSFQILSLQIDNQLRGTPYPVVLSFDEDFKGSLVSQMRNKDGGAKTKIESMMTYAVGISSEPKICLAASKWRNKEMMLLSFEYISLRIGDLSLELDLELLLKLLEFIKAILLLNSDNPSSVTVNDDLCKLGVVDRSFSFAPQNSEYLQTNGDNQFPKNLYTLSDNHTNTPLLPEVVPIGAPWQKIFLLARRQDKIYVEAFSLAPVKMTLSFSSNPWMLKSAGLSSGESLIHRGIMALADVEGAQVCLKELTITHHMASWGSIQEILLKHYSRQFLHEMYKVFGSAGVIGNPMGFARRVGLGVKDFFSVPAKGALQSPSGLISGMAQGTSSLLSNTLYAMSDTATQFSKAAHKGIVAFTFDNHDASKLEQQRVVTSSRSKGVINELFEGLTGLLQSPIKGAEKHGLPGVLSGFALGVTGLVAKPAASVLEATGRTAQSIRNRSRLYRTGPHHLRVRLPRALSAELPLGCYSWDEAIGTAVLLEVDGSKFRDEVLVMCKALQVAGEFVVLTEKLILIIECSSLVDLGKSVFQGIVAEPEWKLVAEIALESVIHHKIDGKVMHIVGSSSEALIGKSQHHHHRWTGGRMKLWSKSPNPLPLFQTDLEFASKEEAEYFLEVLSSIIKKGREQGWGKMYLLHQSNLRK
ncbi:LOW QUALITY PROTEIN: uncharacterized protein LOC110725772 [Chenopodium quinoa]|uniref:LOW QUALITY PROTEIN: uncharacterized protein LOC110725772 n=1 Tax=Chenopodium quinoa TaxID=63459 RepID=UPI000B775C9E|nr:LOW QUALITY PROTEIN: uncharacterized protein LOC110725772 [Chenopodium quinoa]